MFEEWKLFTGNNVHSSNSVLLNFLPVWWSYDSKKLKPRTSKGHLISKGNFGVFESTKKPTIFLKISTLASRTDKIQKQNKCSILDAVGSWQILLPMPNSERTY